MKVGDLVVCISSWDPQSGPQKGCHYQVISVSEEFVGVKVSGTYEEKVKVGLIASWLKTRFRLANETELNYHNFPNKLEEILKD